MSTDQYRAVLVRFVSRWPLLRIRADPTAMLHWPPHRTVFLSPGSLLDHLSENSALLNFRSAAAQVEAAYQGHEDDAAGNQKIVGHGAGEARRILQILTDPAGEQHRDDGEHAGDGEQHRTATAAHV